MYKNKFRTYQLAVIFYKECQKLNLPYYMKDQLQRAALSIVLNLAEGSAKPTAKDRLRFYCIAFASQREVKAVLDLSNSISLELMDKCDHLGASLYKLTHPLK